MRPTTISAPSARHGGKIIHYHGLGARRRAWKTASNYYRRLQRGWAARTISIRFSWCRECRTARAEMGQHRRHILTDRTSRNHSVLRARSAGVEHGKAPDKIIADEVHEGVSNLPRDSTSTFRCPTGRFVPSDDRQQIGGTGSAAGISNAPNREVATMVKLPPQFWDSDLPDLAGAASFAYPWKAVDLDSANARRGAYCGGFDLSVWAVGSCSGARDRDHSDLGSEQEAGVSGPFRYTRNRCTLGPRVV